MPKISSKGALSSQGFGEFSKAISIYKYIGQTKTNAIYGTNSPNLQTSANWTLLPVQPTTLTSDANTGSGVIHYGNSIATNLYRSINGGSYSGWTNFTGPILYASGKNALIATNPTNKLTASMAAVPFGKGGAYNTSVYFVNSGTGEAGTTDTFSGNISKRICYSPQLDSFYVVATSTIRRYSGSTGAYLGDVTNPGGNVYSLSVSSDGYILLLSLAAANIYGSYKMTSADFSTYTTLGFINFSSSLLNVTPWLWNPATSLYYFMRYTGSTSYNLYSSDGTTSPSFVNSFTVTGVTAWRQEIMLNENNAMYFNVFTYTSAGKSAGNFSQTFYSTDNGVTITASGINFMSMDYNPI
jgi:hypothetical protein